MNTTTELLIDYLLIGLGFVLLMYVQAIFINGLYEMFRGNCIENDIKRGRFCEGNLFYNINPDFFERNKHKMWSRPFFSCVRCMSSIWSILTFFPLVIWLFGFHVIEIPFWVIDAIGLVYLNFYLYKKT